MKNLNDVISGVDDMLNSAKQGNFEDVLHKTKSYAERATKRSAERLEISRKRIELLDSKTKLSKAYEKYGKLAYAAAEGEAVDDDAFAAASAEIQLQKMRADMLDAEIKELRERFAEAVKRDAKRDAAAEEATPPVDVEVVEPIDE